VDNVLVYHASYCKVEEPRVIKGKFTKDFGEGFYCTIIREQAERWAKKYETPVINKYNCLLHSKLNIKEFKEMDGEWLDFIVNCRHGKAHAYDIVIGSMANDQIYNYIADYMAGVLTREQFWSLAKFKYPTHQINFCTSQALDCITFISMEVLK